MDALPAHLWCAIKNSTPQHDLVAWVCASHATSWTVSAISYSAIAKAGDTQLGDTQLSNMRLFLCKQFSHTPAALDWPMSFSCRVIPHGLIYWAAAGGHVPTLRFLATWGITLSRANLLDVLLLAIRHDHMDACRFIKETWPTFTKEDMLCMGIVDEAFCGGGGARMCRFVMDLWCIGLTDIKPFLRAVIRDWD